MGRSVRAVSSGIPRMPLFAALGPVLLGFFLNSTTFGADTRTQIDLSGPSWKLWQDSAAPWKDDALFAPPIDLSKVSTNPPTGGWATLDTHGQPVSIPGTSEEYLQKIPGPAGDITGVTWWYRTVKIPEAATNGAGKKILLRFESTRQRAEVYVDQKLVGYDLTGNTPFEVDLSSVAKPGDTIQLAVRITDPGGNFDWHDKGTIAWGKNKLLFSHGFGGITGRVKLLMVDPIYISDLAIQNTRAITTVNADITIFNTTNETMTRNITVNVTGTREEAESFATQLVPTVILKPGENHLRVTLSAPNASPWDPEHPNLYYCKATIADGDATTQRFGFRWFEPVGVGSDAKFLLNGKRIVLRSAISWGFFPTNGMYATPEMAEKQIRTAKAMGLNMLNFHRAIGQPIILEKADELGLLYYEEPGNYDNGADPRNPLARAMAQEKVARMVVRDRSHPSLIIYSMSNETGPSDAAVKNYITDMQMMHTLDPSRTILRASGLRSTPDITKELNTKIHLFPFDDKVYWTGWFDDHHAGGPAVWNDSFYKNPTSFYHLVNDPQEIIYWGEEGAISTPPRLGLIKEELSHLPNLGWDGQMYLDWYAMFDKFIADKKLTDAFPTVDDLCKSMGNISMEHQGRKTQLIRMNNESDGYATNGWESEILENHSGIVDCFRNPKGDPAIMAYYNQPLYVAVMPRTQVVDVGGHVTTDFFLINEKNLHGSCKLVITGKDATDKIAFEQQVPVTVIGGDTYGQLLTQNIDIPVTGAQGLYHITVQLLDADGKLQATGRDDVFVVSWQYAPIPGKGAVIDNDSALATFFKKQKSTQASTYGDDLQKLDWVVAATPPDGNTPVPVSGKQLHDPSGQKPGLLATFFSDTNLQQKVAQRTDKTLDLAVAEGSPADSHMNTLSDYSVRWEGQLTPPTTGDYTFQIQCSGSATLTINGTEVNALAPNAAPPKLPPGESLPPATIHLDRDKPVPIVIEWHQKTGDARCQLLWCAPMTLSPFSPAKLLDRVENDGTTLILLERAADWMPLIQKRVPTIHYEGTFRVGSAWAGGDHFVRAHPLFKDLPVNTAMDWPYQAVVRDGNGRSGLLIDGEEFVAGAFHAHTPLGNPPAPIHLGTAVGIIPLGKGKIIFSTLDIVSNLKSTDGPSDVARKLLCNFIEYAAK